MKKFKILFFVTIVTNLILIVSTVTLNAQEPARPAAQPDARPAFRRPPRIISPEILPDNKVTFRVYSKDASKVTVIRRMAGGS